MQNTGPESETEILHTGCAEDERAEDDHLLPAFVIGFDETTNVPADRPPWLHIIHHQRDPDAHAWKAVGCLLPLAANQVDGVDGNQDLWLLTRALVELGSGWPYWWRNAEPSDELRREIEELTEHTDRATPMTPPRVEAMKAVLMRHMGSSAVVPPIADGGYRGVVRLHHEKPWMFFCGWRLVRRRVDDGGVWYSWGWYSRDLEGALQGSLGTSERPRIFLLW